MASRNRNGLIWHDGGFDLIPRWEFEPSHEAIKTVCCQQLKVDNKSDCTISFYAAGAFNKLYLIDIKGRDKLLIRISLPVDPGHKTLGEVATLRFLSARTNIPVPEVIAFENSSNNAIGFEWMIMQLVPGTSAYHQWRKLPMTKKTALVNRIAEYQATLLDDSNRGDNFRGIGTLKLSETNNQEVTSKTFEPAQMVSRWFFWGDHFDYDIPRGPFRSSHDWLSAHLNIIIREQTQALESTEDEDDKDEAQDILETAERLLSLLPKIFPSLQNPAEHSFLWHGDLSLSNILMNDDGDITTLIDWECVSVMPFWAALRAPKFLSREGAREEEPIRDGYADEDPEEQQVGSFEDDLDNEGKDSLYWIHLMEYETTQLRKVFDERMRELRPGWDMQVAENALKNDFLDAVYRCDWVFACGGIDTWIDAVESGEFPSLQQILKR